MCCRVKAWPDGRIRITGGPAANAMREAEASLFQIHSRQHNIDLPGAIDPHTARALFTLACQLYVRVDKATSHTPTKANAPGLDNNTKNNQAKHAKEAPPAADEDDEAPTEANAANKAARAMPEACMANQTHTTSDIIDVHVPRAGQQDVEVSKPTGRSLQWQGEQVPDISDSSDAGA